MIISQHVGKADQDAYDAKCFDLRKAHEQKVNVLDQKFQSVKAGFEKEINPPVGFFG